MALRGCWKAPCKGVRPPPHNAWTRQFANRRTSIDSFWGTLSNGGSPLLLVCLGGCGG